MGAPCTRRAWNEVGYALASLPLAIAALAFIVAFIGNGILCGLSATGVRKFGAAARSLVRGLPGEDIPASSACHPRTPITAACSPFWPSSTTVNRRVLAVPAFLNDR
jgi:hypothetical protein